MSLRPRPVTATVTKPKWMEPQGRRRRSYDLESNGSTASLTSVLDHDSYVSPAPSDDEWEVDNSCSQGKELSQTEGDDSEHIDSNKVQAQRY